MVDTMLQKFIQQFAVPEEGVPYIDHFVTREEMRLVLAGAAGPLLPETAGRALDISVEAAAAVLEDAFRRGVLDRDSHEDGTMVYTPADFYERMDVFATFDDAWYELPLEVRRALDEWMMVEYMSRKRPAVERLMAGEPPEKSPGNDVVMLVHEIEEIIDRASSFAVVPCNCRRIASYCSRPRETCLRLDRGAERALSLGRGRRLTRDEAKELIHWADRKGLMHTTAVQSPNDVPSGICNCCGDDCYPFRAAARMGTKGVWPRSRYVATLDPEACNHCGACTKRCHFDAFYLDGGTVEVDGRKKRSVAFDAALCWGCGLCANSCPTKAITMAAL